MSSANYILRDDVQYTVVVGWDGELESFFGCVFDSAARTGEPVAAVGQEPHEITAVSELARLVRRFAPLDEKTASALREDARSPDDGGVRG
jgi:hypothetical protein